MKTSNPLQRDSVYAQAYALAEKPMTVSGAASKLFFLSLIMAAGAYMTYYQFMLGHTDFVNMLVTGGCIIGFILVLILSFKPAASPYLAPVYAFAQGAAVSGITCYAESAYKGIAMQAVSLTMLAVCVTALLYSARIIRASEKFRSILFAAGITIFVFYLISMVLTLFGINVPYFTQNTPLNIGINAVIAVIAALYLILDFDFIEKGAERGVPAVYEWYGAFSLLVTVIWLYVEILRLLMRLKDR